jgi:hypothetical protein
MKTIVLFLSVLVVCFSIMNCNDDEVSTPALPTGCASPQGVYAIQVIENGIRCLPTNAFTDANEVLGAPDFHITGPGRTQFEGFASLGILGNVEVFMGSCIQDQPGADLRVYQSVSEESVEVLVSQNAGGPFVSLGQQPCRDQCDFDLAGSGLNNVRVVRVQDTVTDFLCDQDGLSPGADIDAVQVLHPSS